MATETGRIKPIVFMNMPISGETNDIIGISSAVDSIEYAIDNDAKMIGIIADYGTGKSSLTDTLTQNKKKYSYPIRINMWDSLMDGANDKGRTDASKNSISTLTKSFLFQLASGVSDREASHINKKLSKNYNILSFSLSSSAFWVYVGIAVLLYAIYTIVSSTGAPSLVKTISTMFSNLDRDGIIQAVRIVKTICPALLIGSIALIVIGLRKTSVAFSNLKNQTTREPEVNDIFDSYVQIYKKLLSRKKRRLVIIEDLDRIVNKTIILGFLKEIYRFNNVTTKSKKMRPVFIIAVKPEDQLLETDEDKKFYDDKDIYAKLFDYTVVLKPINFTDYRQLIIAIIGDKKASLNEILAGTDIVEAEKLPKSFDWLVEGQNLTIRQLKDRLNHAVSLFVTLKNKKYESQPYVSFSTCAAVAYLELQYPKEYSLILKSEDGFATLVRDANRIKNTDSDDEKETIHKIVDAFLNVACNEQNNEGKLLQDFIKMLQHGDIDSDFRMYFYSFPKGSYIKNNDEKDISNLLLRPIEYSEDKELSEKVERIREGNKENTIIEALREISTDPAFLSYPPIIFKDQFLFAEAYSINFTKTNLLLQKEANWANTSMVDSEAAIRAINSFMFEGKPRIWNTYFDWLLKEFENFTDSHIIEIRKKLIAIFNGDIKVCEKLFIVDQVDGQTDSVPIITNEELTLINNIDIGIRLISTTKIAADNFEYIAAHLSKRKLCATTYDIARSFFDIAIKLMDRDALRPLAISFLKQNKKIDDTLFAFAVSEDTEDAIDNATICTYIKKLTTKNLTNKYLELLDMRIIYDGLDEQVLSLLIDRKLYTSVLASYLSSQQLCNINFSAQTNIKPIIAACERINTNNPQMIPIIREAIIRKHDLLVSKSSLYKSLFFAPYPLIEIQELQAFNNMDILLDCINVEGMDEDNCEYFVSFFNAKSLKSEECAKLFDIMLNEDEYTHIITNSEIIKKIVDGLDYSVVAFAEMSDLQKEAITVWLTPHLTLSSAAEAQEFMLKVKCQIASLEKLLVTRGQIALYIALINEMNCPTAYTWKWLYNTKIEFALPESITGKLLIEEKWDMYLIGKTLFDGNYTFPVVGVPDSISEEQYIERSPIFEQISNNYDFICHLINTECYLRFPIENKKVLLRLLLPLYQARQTITFVKFLFIHLNVAEKKSYLQALNEINSAQDSKEIAYFLVEDDNIILLDNYSLFQKVREQLWENVPSEYRGYKGQFTKKWNEKFAHLIPSE